MRRILIIMSTAMALLCAHTAFARNLELSDYLNWEQVGDPRISPDGKRIVYTRSRVNKLSDSLDSEIWQMSATGERNRFLLKGGGANGRCGQ